MPGNVPVKDNVHTMYFLSINKTVSKPELMQITMAMKT